jgi:RecJ-like exonuclease
VDSGHVLALVTDMTSFGAAGLMGAMWLWERRQSRIHEQQIREAHSRILRDEQRLEKLTRVVEHNTAALTRFEDSQRMMAETLKDLAREVRHDRMD